MKCKQYSATTEITFTVVANSPKHARYMILQLYDDQKREALKDISIAPLPHKAFQLDENGNEIIWLDSKNGDG